MMKTYQHTQPALTILIWLVSTGLLFAAMSLYFVPFIAGTIVEFIVAFVFRSMTIEISDTELTWYFGSGFPLKRVPLGEVVSAEVVRTSVWNG
jgi:hypothetical protein